MAFPAGTITGAESIECECGARNDVPPGYRGYEQIYEDALRCCDCNHML
ncbi:MAG: hypothetical protein PVI21_03840 [Candidatus Woesebacteria bacterium]